LRHLRSSFSFLGGEKRALLNGSRIRKEKEVMLIVSLNSWARYLVLNWNNVRYTLFFPGDSREDKKRRLHQGHARESTSRQPDGDLENMFSSLTIDNILSQGTSGCATPTNLLKMMPSTGNPHYYTGCVPL
jgi:hypothetical protein